MIEDIKSDCPLNSKIKIEFEDGHYHGSLIQIDDKKLKLQTGNTIILLTAKKLEQLVSYEVIGDGHQGYVTENESILPPSEEKDEDQVDNNIGLQKSDLPDKFQYLFEEIENPSYNLVDEEFDFINRKVSKYDVDEETFELCKQLERVESKYRYALKTTDKESRYREILQILNLLLANNYFNSELRYNIAFFHLKLKEIDKGIKVLEEIQGHKKHHEGILLLSYLYLTNKNTLRTLQCFYDYLKLKQSFNREKGLFFIHLIKQESAYLLLNDFYNRFNSDPNFFSNEDFYWITEFLLEELNQKGVDRSTTKSESYDVDIKFNLEVLQRSTDPEITEAIEVEYLKEKSENVLTANSEIIQYWATSERGDLYYIDDKKRKFLASFKASDIIEQDIKNKLSNGRLNHPIPVFCSITDNPNHGPIKKAIGIQLPKPVNLQIAAIKSWIKKDELTLARELLGEIILQFPEEVEAKELLKQLPSPPPAPSSSKSGKLKPKRKGKTFKYYHKANLARQQQKWDEAKDLFIKAIELNQNKESAIKDLAAIYQKEGDNRKAIALVEKHLDEMSNKEASYNFLSHLYLTDEQYDKSVEALKIVLSLNPVKNTDLRKRSLEIKKRMAYCYVKAKDYNSSKRLLNEILKKSPDDQIARKWLDGLEEAEQTGKYENIESLFSERDFNILMTGLSPLMIDALEKCTYDGLKEPEKVEENFTQDTLKRHRDQINESLGNRPTVRASYRLTEAKLIQILEPDNESSIKSALAKYCNDIALSCAGSNFPSPIIRSYYLEAFSLEMNWDSIARQVSLFLSTFYLTGDQLVIENQKGISIEKAINNIFVLEDVPKSLWNTILEMSIANPTITAQILWKIYKHKKAKKSVFQFLNSLGITVNNTIDENSFKEKWNIAREKRKGEFDGWFDRVNALTNVDSINTFAAIIGNSFDQINQKWLNEFDSSRLESINRDIVNLCLDYLKQSVFDEKERLYGIITASIERISEDIIEKPTKFSYEGFFPLLKHIDEILNDHFERVIENSTPSISLQVQGDVAVVNGRLNVQVAVVNEDRQKAPIYDATLTIEETEDFKLDGEPVVIFDTIRGGEQKMVELPLKVSKNLIDQKIGDFQLVCKYKARNLNDYLIIKSGQTISLYDKSEFKPIENIFARYANSNAVKDEEMFKGRDNFIEDIINTFLTSHSKCVVIYGQKRSGKSSVLYHLKKRLNATQKAFCIDFSLGSIITEWSITAFYNKILSEIDRELRRIKRNGDEVPLFEKPSIASLEKHPTSIFQETMEEFLDQCQELDHWKNKKLTVLIDEFTYLYSSIQRRSIPSDFMKVWKDIVDQSYFNSVLIGQDVMPDFMAQFPNQFGVVEDKRLNYLDSKDAKELIERPIWNIEKDESRFLGKAVDKIIDYTAGNPYYIQIFGDRLVSYMNDACRSQVTELTVDEVAKSLTEGKDALLEKQFDNLLTAGDADLERNPPEYTFEVLKQIAKASKNFGYCSKESIAEYLINLNIKDKLDEILKDLHLRQVVSLKQGNYRIQVQLFQQWLLNH